MQQEENFLAGLHKYKIVIGFLWIYDHILWYLMHFSWNIYCYLASGAAHQTTLNLRAAMSRLGKTCSLATFRWLWVEFVKPSQVVINTFFCESSTQSGKLSRNATKPVYLHINEPNTVSMNGKLKLDVLVLPNLFDALWYSVDTLNLMSFDFFQFVSRYIILLDVVWTTTRNFWTMPLWKSKTLERIVPWISGRTSKCETCSWSLDFPILTLVSPTSTPVSTPRIVTVSGASNVAKQKVSRFSRKSRPTGQTKWIFPNCPANGSKWVHPPIVRPISWLVTSFVWSLIGTPYIICLSQ